MQASVGISHAKIILMGEHAVVYQQPAIALPIGSIQLRAQLTPAAKHQHIISSFYTGTLAAASHTDFSGIATLIRQLLTFFNATTTGFTLTIDSQLPAERGMGSSAATAVAVVRAFYAAFATKLSAATLRNWASVSEKLIHGNPSGLDAATTSARHPQWFVRGQNPQALRLPAMGSLVIADTGVRGHTGEAVGQVAQRLTADRPRYQPMIEGIGDLVRRGAVALAQNDLVQLGRLMQTNQTALVALGVSTPKLNDFVATAQQAGALGAKLTGSGLGGCMIALAENTTKAQQIQSALQQAGASKTWRYDFKTKDDSQ